MLTHEQIWLAIDRLASSFGYSPSGLAKKAGLDSTSFNKSKRTGPDGKPRWPSTESLSRVLGATGATMSDFIALVDDAKNAERQTISVPVIGFAQAGSKGYFDEEGYPQGDSWNVVDFPLTGTKDDTSTFALEVTGNSMEPLYRDGDILILSPESKTRVGDRVVIKTTDGEVMAKELKKQNASRVEILSLNPDHENRKILQQDIVWMSRILWVSQ